MNKNINIPNFITSLRLVGTICLLFMTPLSPAFFIVYSITGITDALDGFIARRTSTVSEFGAKLDSIADIIFYFVMIVKILPILCVKLPVQIWYAVTAVLILRIASYIVAAIKYRRFASLHTLLNKLTGIAIFSVPFMLGLPCAVQFCVIVCIIAGLASAEELLIHITGQRYNASTKSIFSNDKNTLKNS